MEKWLLRLRRPDDGAGSGGDGQGAEPGAEQGAGSPQLGGADGGQISIYRPDGIAEHQLGQDDRGTIDKLLSENRGFREAQSKQVKPPEKADGYTFEWGERIAKDFGGVAADDVVLGKFRELAHEHGFTQKQMDAVPKLMEFMAEQDLLDKPFDSGKLLAELAPAGFRGTAEEQQAKGAERLNVAESWIKQLPDKSFDQDMRNELRLLTTSAAGVRVVERMMNAGFTASVSPGAGSAAAPVTKQTLDQRLADPRNDSFGEKYDPAFAQDTDAMFRQLYK